uniref:Uncharacterized protein n=1 Tax=Nelumbo nucifera TaxID=4432 RepID=A0A822XTJ3_NELNU|nr:TPA_asm: hypothetical protein HUJ06_023882 [Nelumbo nucifera]
MKRIRKASSSPWPWFFKHWVTGHVESLEMEPGGRDRSQPKIKEKAVLHPNPIHGGKGENLTK